MPSGACRAVSAPGACWTCWTTNCCAAAKPFIGYSDITALHLAIQRHAGFVTFHGPMLAQDLLNGREEPTESALYAMVGGRMGQGAWIGAPDYALPTTLMPGTATGRLAGGNLALICAMQARATRSTRATPSCSSRTSEAVRASTACCRSWRRRASSNRSRACWRAVSRAPARATMRSSSTRSIPAARALRPAGHSRAGRLAQWPRRSEPDAAAGRAGHVGRDAAGPAAGAGGHALSWPCCPGAPRPRGQGDERRMCRLADTPAPAADSRLAGGCRDIRPPRRPPILEGMAFRAQCRIPVLVESTNQQGHRRRIVDRAQRTAAMRAEGAAGIVR